MNEHGDKLAVRDDERELTWVDMEARADSVAAALQERGIEEGDRVCLQLPNVVEWYVARLGIFRAGGVTATLMPWYRRREIERLSRETPTAYIGPSDYRDYDHVSTVLDLRETVDSLEHVIATGDAVTSDATSFSKLTGTSTDELSPVGLGPDYPDRPRFRTVSRSLSLSPGFS